ncbi:MAG TPA: SH3 domain-containing protein [Thermoanaerobaculaceae bacterium]|nr:SH3 domain-containing protein [Thermoanaerobaculaceae bacterium]HPS76799.1 SH3 domain-containing protein [Thermoanaerobaculaceae bacterium]
MTKPVELRWRAPGVPGLLIGILLLQACASVSPPAPPPEPPPAAVEVIVAPPPPPPPAYVRVTGSSLNVREGAGTTFRAVAKARKNDRLLVVEEQGGWTKVQVRPDQTGWVDARYVRREEPCPADKSTAEILNGPDAVLRPAGTGRVVLEATVSTKGEVTAVKLVENTTGSDDLRFRTESELRALRFSPPVRNCKPRPFIYVYSRAF